MSVLKSQRGTSTMQFVQTARELAEYTTSVCRKLKKFKKWVDCGKMSIDDVWISCKSWVGYASYFDAYRSRQNLNKLYKELFVCTK